MADDPLYPRLTIRQELGTIESFSPINLSDVPEGMLLKLGAPLNIKTSDMQVEQTDTKDIKVFFVRAETDDEYWTRVNALKSAAVEEARALAAAREEDIAWQKFLQLADRFHNRILVLTLAPEFDNT
jgi:hypothetical protein